MALNFANNNSLSAITTKPSGLSGGAMTLISEQTASSSATISFPSGIDSTYDSYVFKFINIHPATNASHFEFNGSTDSGSNYNVTKTTTVFRAYHTESDSTANLLYEGSFDLAQSTAFQQLAYNTGNNNDDNVTGYLQIFNPSDTTFVKHFISRTSYSHQTSASAEIDSFCAGYFNTTSVINAIIFRMSSGNIDSGVIKLYGIS